MASNHSDTEILKSKFRRAIMPKTQPRQIGECSEKIGNVTFLIRSFDNPASRETSEQLMLGLLESKVREITKQESEVKSA